MSIAKTTRPYLLTREAAAARIEALEAALRDILGAHDLYETECIASAALAEEQDK